MFPDAVSRLPFSYVRHITKRGKGAGSTWSERAPWIVTWDRDGLRSTTWDMESGPFEGAALSGDSLFLEPIPKREALVLLASASQVTHVEPD